MPGEFDELDFLSKAALALAELGPEEDLFVFVAEQLSLIAPDSLIVTSAYEPQSRSIVVRAMAGPQEMQQTARGITGEPLGQVFPLDEEAHQLLSKGGLQRIQEGMHQLTFRRWPRELAGTLEVQLGVQSVYGQPFLRKGDYVGGVSFINRTPSLDHPQLIEAFIHLAAVAIQRQRAEAQLRDSERLFRMLAENSRDVIFRLRLRPAVAFEYVSPATLHLCGRAPEEIYADARLGCPCLYPEQWRDAPPLRELSSQPVVASFHRKNGELAWTEQNFTPVRDSSGLIVAVEGISRDITHRKEAEDALIESDRRKTEFLAVLSHELRNPLGAIGNGAHVLARIAPGGAQAKRVQSMIERQITQLTRLIDDLLDVTRITRGKIQLQRERVELGELIHVAVEDHRAALESARIDVHEVLPASGVFVFADGTRIRQVLDNLLHNAEKFTPPGGRATVSLRTDREHDQALIRVQNTGVHIPAGVLKHLFEPFVQAEQPAARGKGGLGLGLALVKGIIQLHEGTVDVETDEREGTAFTIRLPLEASVAEPRSVESPVLASANGHKRVLVIEDNVDNAESLRDALEVHGYTVAVASTGREGIETAHTFLPDVVVCDIGLPEMDGYEVARAVRADPTLHELPLVALTGYASPADVAKSREAGFNRHVSKPPSVEDLDRMIAELVH